MDRHPTSEAELPVGRQPSPSDLLVGVCALPALAQLPGLEEGLTVSLKHTAIRSEFSTARRAVVGNVSLPSPSPLCSFPPGSKRLFHFLWRDIYRSEHVYVSANGNFCHGSHLLTALERNKSERHQGQVWCGLQRSDCKHGRQGVILPGDFQSS